MGETIESKVANAILQESEEISVGDKTYQVAPPSTATLILASEAISLLPHVELNNDNIASESLCVAKDCRAIGDIVAILMLGAKGLTETRKTVKTRWFGLVKEERDEIIDSKAILAAALLNELSPRALNELLTKLLTKMEIAFFFATSTSLIGINLLRKTREAKTIASGR